MKRWVPRVTAQEFLGRCRRFHMAGDLSAGLKACEEVLSGGARGRLRAVALRYKALFLLGGNPGWASEAVSCLKEALDCAGSLPADQAHVLTLLTAAYGMFGSVGYAEECRNRFLRLSETAKSSAVDEFLPRLWYNLGCCYQTAQMYLEAAGAFEKALACSDFATTGFTRAWPEHNLVHVYLELGRTSEAVAMLERVRDDLDLVAFRSYFKDEEARCLLALGDLEGAEAACREAISDPTCTDSVRAEVLFTMARIQYIRGNVSVARQLAEQALEHAIRLLHPRLLHKAEGFLMTLK